MSTYQMVSHEQIKLAPGFWYDRRELARKVSLMAVYHRFRDTGRFDAWDFTWKEGDPNRPHIFWDSDIAKWIESAAYLLEEEENEEVSGYFACCDHGFVHAGRLRRNPGSLRQHS